MQKLKAFLTNEYMLIFFFCFAAIAGPALSTLFSYDISQFHDCESYLGLANWNFDQSPVRRYRILEPFAARALNAALGNIFAHLAPTYFKGDFSLPFSFFLINMMLTSWYGVLIYRFCKAYGLGTVPVLLGLVVFITGRYTIYMAAFPMVDALYCVAVMLALTGVKEKNSTMQLAAIFLGPFAKEAFIFVAPVILLCSHIPRSRLLVYFILSGIVVFVYRYVYDLLAGPGRVNGLVADLYHFNNFGGKLIGIFKPYNLYKIISNIGLWLFLPFITAWVTTAYKARLKAVMDKVVLVFLAGVLVQMILSDTVERMFYQAMPVLVLIAAVSFDALRKHYSLLKNKFI